MPRRGGGRHAPPAGRAAARADGARGAAGGGATIIFSPHVIAHAERLCERIAIIAGGKVAFEGAVDAARDRLRPIVRLRTRTVEGPWRSALPADARLTAREWRFELPPSGPEPL